MTMPDDRGPVLRLHPRRLSGLTLLSAADPCVMHGSANLAIPLLLPNVDRTWSLFATGSIYLLLAGALVVQSRLPSARSSAARLIDPKEVAA